MKLIIAGGRDFEDYGVLVKMVDMFISTYPDNDPIEIVSGKCPTGADKLGERYAIQRNYPVKEFYADWQSHGKAAGPIRNEKMAKYATHCICFWDRKSKGTKSMIDLAKKYNLILHIILYES